MFSLHYLQYFVFTACINIFTIYIYIIYFGGKLTSQVDVVNNKEYDYVIVGSGTAGSLVAHMISSKTNYTFIILEAGSTSNFMFEIPVLGPLLHGSVYDWNFRTVPQKGACLAMLEKKCRLAQGKILGGSSKLNNMVYVRGNVSHYTNWFNEKHTRRYIEQKFKFIEDNVLHLDELQFESELAVAVLEAARELNYEILNNDFKIGFRKTRLTQKSGKRWCTSDSVNRRYVLTNSLVEKVLLDGNTARGVEFFSSGKKYSVYAKKGVILSAGTYNTPKILQLSGIGPASLLKKFDIPLIMDLPVGRNLQEHIGTGLDLILINSSLNMNPVAMLNPLNVLNYFVNGKGPFTSPGCEAVGFLSTKNDSVPDIQFMVLPVGISSDKGANLRKVLGINDEVWNDYFVKTFDYHSASILPILLHPKSRGEVKINSRDPKVEPVIDQQFLSHNEDLEILVSGLKLLLKFVKTKAMQNIGAYINTIKFPGCEDFDFFSDHYLKCYVKYLTLTNYHPVGTCSMGTPGSKDAVVDSSFKVFGVNNLFVVDGSVLPSLPSANINAAIALMASIFFDVNINQSFGHSSCNINDQFFEYLYKICISN